MQIIRFSLIFLVLVVVRGGGWMFRGVGPGRGDAVNIKLAHEEASTKRYGHF